MKTYFNKFGWSVLALGFWQVGAGALRAEEARNVIERVPGRGGYIEVAHVRTRAEVVEVSGYVRRSTVGAPPAGAHVDVYVIGAGRTMIETVSVRFAPAKIPAAGRLGLPHARFRVQLSNRPPADATIRVVFHGGPAGTGGCAVAKAAKTVGARQEAQ